LNTSHNIWSTVALCLNLLFTSALMHIYRMIVGFGNRRLSQYHHNATDHDVHRVSPNRTTNEQQQQQLTAADGSNNGSQVRCFVYNTLM
jgi:hypothetical protein